MNGNCSTSPLTAGVIAPAHEQRLRTRVAGERGGNRVARLAAGSQRLGASIVEPASGALQHPYHMHHANEEL